MRMRQRDLGDPPWLTVARREIGVREAFGEADNARIIEYLKTTHIVPAQYHDETAWCAAFVGWCLEKSGIEPSRKAKARSYVTWGAELEQPELGCVVVLTRGTNPNQGHVGFYVGEDGSDILLLGGNQNNAVSIAPYAKLRVLSYRWPHGED